MPITTTNKIIIIMEWHKTTSCIRNNNFLTVADDDDDWWWAWVMWCDDGDDDSLLYFPRRQFAHNNIKKSLKSTCTSFLHVLLISAERREREKKWMNCFHGILIACLISFAHFVWCRHMKKKCRGEPTVDDNIMPKVMYFIIHF